MILLVERHQWFQGSALEATSLTAFTAKCLNYYASRAGKATLQLCYEGVQRV